MNGLITFLIGILFIILGYNEFPSKFTEYQNKLSYTEHTIKLKENPQMENYNSWIKQRQRLIDRGKIK